MLNILFASLPIFLFAIIIHEYSHGLVAYLLGDPTPKLYGRLTLNPLYHIDIFGTLILPFILIISHSPVVFGWAKPVPINSLNFKHPKRDIIWVGLSGPLANLFIAIFFTLLLKLNLAFLNNAIIFIINLTIFINLVLAIFNLFPIPPLDGSKIIFGILPERFSKFLLAIEPYGFIILIVLLWMGLINKIIWPIVLYSAKILSVLPLPEII
ncbi:MAG: site-2 protease family protein [Candidatus Omnitrophica bacterium]|nr:site-2 protease family protein [Candidatus Omnitrophota bacterium]